MQADIRPAASRAPDGAMTPGSTTTTQPTSTSSAPETAPETALETSLSAPPSPQKSSATLTATPAPPPPPAPLGFAFPHYYHFPPMFTLQPNLATRRAQMDKWSTLILDYCRYYRIFRLVLGGPTSDTSGPVRMNGEEDVNYNDHDSSPCSVPYYAPDLFRNRQIDRALTPAAAREVLGAMRQEGRIEWLDDVDSSTATSCYVYWNTPDEWAAIVDAWIDDTAQRGSVLTLYELTSGDATRGSELHGLDPVVLQRALTVLVKRGRAQIFGAAESLGVKFF